jgi:dihydroneopterin aldolase
MAVTSSIELKDMILATDIGTYGPDDIVPDHHLLDLTLDIAATRMLITTDCMAHVFDYDPLIADIKTLAATDHHETQEWLVTQIVLLCAQYPEIEGACVHLRKFPVGEGSGTLGIRLTLAQCDLVALRAS